MQIFFSVLCHFYPMEKISVVVCVIKRMFVAIISNVRKLRSHEGNKLREMKETNRLLTEILETLKQGENQ